MTEYNQRVPVIVGMNVIRLCRSVPGAYTEDVPEAWRTAMDSTAVGNSVPVKTTNNFPITIGPYQVMNG